MCFTDTAQVRAGQGKCLHSSHFKATLKSTVRARKRRLKRTWMMSTEGNPISPCPLPASPQSTVQLKARFTTGVTMTISFRKAFSLARWLPDYPCYLQTLQLAHLFLYGHPMV